MNETSEKQIREICRAFTEMLVEKNKRYGNAAITPLNVFAGHTNNPDTERLCVRLDEKLSRIKTQSELKVNDIVDTCGYSILLLIQLGITDFDIQQLID
jgi:uncharacterized protein YcbK (DUF882 family)